MLADAVTESRFTARGGAAVEGEIGRLVGAYGDLVRSQVDGSSLRALVLIGGYGRGEGGVELRSGRERPHNNLDFLLITRGLSAERRRDLATRLEGPTEMLRRQADVGLDLSVVPETRIRFAPCLVMWYDARFGHRTILGDRNFLPSLTRFRADRIPAADVLNLMVNRGTLLLINDQLRALGGAGKHLGRSALKHRMKAIIGFGDALLFQRRGYHWSYRVKQRRFRRLRGVDPALRSLYDEAIEFRFQPDYDAYGSRASGDREVEIRRLLETVHLGFEAWRLERADLGWPDYLTAAAEHLGRTGWLVPRRAARKLLAVRRHPSVVATTLGSWAKLGLRTASRRERLSIGFPALAYQQAFDAMRERLAPWLEIDPSEGLEMPAARARYLRLWGEAGDHNFGLVARSLGLEPGLENAA